MKQQVYKLHSINVYNVSSTTIRHFFRIWYTYRYSFYFHSFHFSYFHFPTFPLLSPSISFLFPIPFSIFPILLFVVLSLCSSSVPTVPKETDNVIFLYRVTMFSYYFLLYPFSYIFLLHIYIAFISFSFVLLSLLSLSNLTNVELPYFPFPFLSFYLFPIRFISFPTPSFHIFFSYFCSSLFGLTLISFRFFHYAYLNCHFLHSHFYILSFIIHICFIFLSYPSHFYSFISNPFLYYLTFLISSSFTITTLLQRNISNTNLIWISIV